MFNQIKLNIMKVVGSLFAAGVVITALVACQKEFTTIEDAVPVVEQETIVEELVVELDAMADEAISLKLNEGKSTSGECDFYLSSCSVITIDNTTDPKVITIDFGTGCTGKDGKVRSGKIIITSTSFTDATSERIKTFEDFYVDGRKVEGVVNKTITLNRQDHSRVAEIVENITITFPDEGCTARRVASLIREYRFNDPEVLRDNIVTSYGTVEFTRVNGLEITKTISGSDPLVFKVSCHRIVSGLMTITTSDNRSWTIDYGDGECDNLATVTNGDNTRIIRLR
jgi:hypothetical protein